ncbi:MAG: hypothetical protein AB7K68_03380 [Bacteriovoracia bacterium]
MKTPIFALLILAPFFFVTSAHAECVSAGGSGFGYSGVYCTESASAPQLYNFSWWQKEAPANAEEKPTAKEPVVGYVSPSENTANDDSIDSPL